MNRTRHTAERRGAGAVGVLLALTLVACGSAGGASPAPALWPTAEAAQKTLADSYGYAFKTGTTDSGDPQWRDDNPGGSWFLSIAGQPGAPLEGVAAAMGDETTQHIERLVETVAPSVLPKLRDAIASRAKVTATVNYTWEAPGGEVGFSYAPSLGMTAVYVKPTGAANGPQTSTQGAGVQAEATPSPAALGADAAAKFADHVALTARDMATAMTDAGDNMVQVFSIQLGWAEDELAWLEMQPEIPCLAAARKDYQAALRATQLLAQKAADSLTPMDPAAMQYLAGQAGEVGTQVAAAIKETYETGHGSACQG